MSKSVQPTKERPGSLTPTQGHGRRTTLQVIALLMGLAATLMSPYLYFFSVRHLDALAPALIAAMAWTAFALLRLNYSRLVPHLIVFGTLMAAVVGVITFGSMRSAAMLLFVAGVAGAGVFLNRAALIATVAFSFLAMSALLWAEKNGVLVEPVLQVRGNTLAVYMIVTLVVAIMVYHSRQAAQQANSRLQNELEARRLVEQERDRNLERFARIFRTNPVAVITQSAVTGEILDVNPAFERCYGYSRAQVIGKTDRFLWGQPSQRESYREKLLRSKRVDQFSIEGLRADGSRFDAHISSEMNTDTEDMLLITSVTDMTEQNLAVERVRRSEERFAKAFNLSPLFMVITRLSDGQVLEVNRLEDNLPGITPESVRTQTTQSLGIWTSEEERARFLGKLKSEGQVKAFDTQMRNPNGVIMDARIWAVLIDIENEPCILACSMNITEEKRRNDLLLDIAKGMTGATAHAFFQALTQRMANALGAEMVLIGETNSAANVQTLAAFQGGQRVENFQFPLAGSACAQALEQFELSVCPSGLSSQPDCPLPFTTTPFEAGVCQALHDAEGQTIGILSALWTHPIQVTDEMRALIAIFASRATAELLRLRSERETERLNSSLELRVRERTAELRKLNAELDSFAYSISHDLKSPLRAIDGFTQLLSEQLDGRLDAEERHLMERVLGATQRMSTLMADLLALARVSQFTMQHEQINLSQLAEEVMAKALRDRPRPTLEWQVEPDVYGNGDLDLVRTLLAHLIDNALKYTRDQAKPLIEFGQLRDRCEAAEAASPFFVRDNGVGFSMEHADKLFKPFQRLHMPSAGFEGTGIGLATARRIVERHGGMISATARPDQGAEFRFTLEQSVQATALRA